jgi:hypothetical protein
VTLLVVLAGIAAYLAVGFGYVAPRYVTRQVEGRIRRFSALAEEPGKVDGWRREEAGFSVLPALSWPFYLLGRALLGRIVAAAPPTSFELRAENEAQAKRIAELERELGVGQEQHPHR